MTLFLLGIIGIFVSLAMIFKGCVSVGNEDGFQSVGPLIGGLTVLVVSLCITAVGALGICAEKSGKKAQKKEQEADDSQNKAMKENFERLLLESKHSDKTDKQ